MSRTSGEQPADSQIEHYYVGELYVGFAVRKEGDRYRLLGNCLNALDSTREGVLAQGLAALLRLKEREEESLNREIRLAQDRLRALESVNPTDEERADPTKYFESIKLKL